MAGLVINGQDVNSISLNGQDVTKISDGVNTLWELPVDDRNYMYLENTSNGVGTLTLSKSGTPNATELYYSLDKSNWSPFDLTQATNTVSVPSGGKVYFRGDNSNGFNAAVDNKYTFSMNVSHIAGGDSRSLISATDFENVTTMPQGCYCQLFISNTTITGASDLLFPFANVSQDGMRAVFNGCTSLTSIPSLSTITSVGQDGLRYFAAGSRITSVDLSSVKSVGTTGFASAFNGCSQLNNVKCMNLDSWDTAKMGSWLNGVAGSGTFTKPLGLAILRGSVNTIPTGWTLNHYFNEYYYLPFYMENTTSSSATFTLAVKQNGTSNNYKNYLNELQYSFDNSSWNTLNIGTITTTLRNITVSVPANGRIYLRGNNPNGLINPNGDSFQIITNLQLNVSYKIGGNILSLISKDFTNYTSNLPTRCFRAVFGSVYGHSSSQTDTNTNLKDASKLIIPIRTVSERCFHYAFSRAINLTQLPDMSYINTLGWYGCCGIFMGNNYSGTTVTMKYTNGPDWSGVTSIGNYSLQYAQKYSKVNTVTAPNVSSWSSSNPVPTYEWLSNVASSGKVYKPSALKITTSSSDGVPSGWSTSNY